MKQLVSLVLLLLATFPLGMCTARYLLLPHLFPYLTTRTFLFQGMLGGANRSKLLTAKHANFTSLTAKIVTWVMTTHHFFILLPVRKCAHLSFMFIATPTHAQHTSHNTHTMPTTHSHTHHTRTIITTHSYHTTVHESHTLLVSLPSLLVALLLPAPVCSPLR
jgi:hypothetical protein